MKSLMMHLKSHCMLPNSHRLYQKFAHYTTRTQRSIQICQLKINQDQVKQIFLGNGNQCWSSVLSDRACKEDEKPESPDPCFDSLL